MSFLREYNVSILIAFVGAVVFSMGDFLTSSIATNMGLFESNFLLTSLAGTFRISLMSAFALTKVGIIAGTTLTGVVGVRSRDRQMKKLALGVVAFFAILFLFVTINNIYWIYVD